MNTFKVIVRDMLSCLILILLSIGIDFAFPKRYVTPFYPNWLRNGNWSKLKVSALWSKIEIFYPTLNFNQLPFLSQLNKEGVTYLFGKAKLILIESKIEIGHNNFFQICQANFKTAHLLNKMALVQSQSGRTVPKKISIVALPL